MKKLSILIVVFCLSISLSVWATPPVEGVNSKEITFYGIDYSLLKLVHKEDFVDKLGVTQCQAMKSRYFQEWNEIFITEKSKFDIQRLFSVDKYKIDLDRSVASIPSYDNDCVTEDEGYKIPESAFAKIVANYTDKSTSGIGVVMVGESMNKRKASSVYHIVYFKINTGEILSKNIATGQPGGIGMSNFWVNALYDALSNNLKYIKSARKGK